MGSSDIVTPVYGLSLTHIQTHTMIYYLSSSLLRYVSQIAALKMTQKLPQKPFYRWPLKSLQCLSNLYLPNVDSLRCAVISGLQVYIYQRIIKVSNIKLTLFEIYFSNYFSTY